MRAISPMVKNSTLKCQRFPGAFPVSSSFPSTSIFGTTLEMNKTSRDLVSTGPGDSKICSARLMRMIYCTNFNRDSVLAVGLPNVITYSLCKFFNIHILKSLY